MLSWTRGCKEHPGSLIVYRVSPGTMCAWIRHYRRDCWTKGQMMSHVGAIHPLGPRVAFLAQTFFILQHQKAHSLMANSLCDRSHGHRQCSRTNNVFRITDCLCTDSIVCLFIISSIQIISLTYHIMHRQTSKQAVCRPARTKSTTVQTSDRPFSSSLSPFRHRTDDKPSGGGNRQWHWVGQVFKARC